MTRLFRVGLTGNIASGKSSVVEVWRAHGAHVIDADVLARQAMAPGTRGHERVLAQFGTVDRAALRDIVFRDPAQRKQLESIIHPEVARLRSEQEAALAAQGVRVVVHDIPLLFEAGLAEQFDAIVVVDAPVDLRIERLVRTRGLERAQAERMVAAQGPAAAKRARAHFVIDNAGSMSELQTKAEEVWQQILLRASA